ncbi:MAG: terminase family protein [Acidimicrobiales bacterium]|nr:terminase family protein [Acidimicrobiales bacterium]
MAKLARELGRPLFPWQQAVVDVALERSRYRYRYPLVTVSVPRQSGKTTLVALLAVHRCRAQAESQVWYTAQSRMDAVLRWRELVRVLRRSNLVELLPWARKAAAEEWDFRIRATTGEETIEFPNGSAIRLFAPSEDSLHGSVTDLVIIDEARFFDERQGNALMAAVLPTQATRDGQVWITSTAGSSTSTFLHRQLVAGRESLTDRQARRAHAEWGITEPHLRPGDLLERVWAAHPSAGLPGGINRDALMTSADTMPAWQFAHEFGNRWRTEADDRLLPEHVWERSVALQPMGEGTPVFGVDVALDRSTAAVVACVGGVCQLVEVTTAASVVDRCIELVGKWGGEVWVDAGGPAATVAESLRYSTVADQLKVTSTRELAAACGAFYDALMADPPQVWHRPSAELDDVAAQARRRPLGQSWAFDRGPGPAMIAMVLAWAGDHHRSLLEAAPMPAVF